MTGSLLSQPDWRRLLRMLGGAQQIEGLARETRAFLRARGFDNACVLLRMILVYCLSDKGLRLTAGWAASVGLADVSNVALLQRLKASGPWLEALIGQLLAAQIPKTFRGRTIRIVDATSVPKKGAAARRGNGLWRVHAAFDLTFERFGSFELTDETGSERLDRFDVPAGGLIIADRVYMNTGQIAGILDQGGDILVRSGWKSVRWQNAKGRSIHLAKRLARARAHQNLIDEPIFLARKYKPPLALRLVAMRKPEGAREASETKARRAAQKEACVISPHTLRAAGWMILITSLEKSEYSGETICDLYRLRWRIELAFKRLKSQIGLKGPPGKDESAARAFVLAHLLMILLLEPLTDGFEDSPPQALTA